MALLLVGVLLFAGIHFIPSLAPGVKSRWRGALGEGGYKGSFTLLALGAIVTIVNGWKSAVPSLIYLPPSGLHLPAIALLALALVMLVAGMRNSRIHQWVRHPQLCGVLLWAVAHLLLNGDSRSLVLFGGLGLWSIGEMLTINRREGQWVKPAIPPMGSELLTVVIAAAVFAGLLLAHPYIAGVPVVAPR